MAMVKSENNGNSSEDATESGPFNRHEVPVDTTRSPIRPQSSQTATVGTTTPTQQIARLEVLDGSSGEFLEPLRTPRDDNSRYQFMSEPSLSEEGSDRILAPHRLPAGPNAFRRLQNSPGNTSLSSWDVSPGGHVQLHFSSSPNMGPSMPPVTVENHDSERRVRVQPLLPRHSVMADASNDEGSSGPPTLPNIGQASETSPKSINMALSDSEDECMETAAIIRNFSSVEHSASGEATPLEGNLANNQQQRAPLPNKVAARPRNHRRTRSGDAAAASLATGGYDWKGMTKDQIPIPEVAGDESDDSPSPARSDARVKRNTSHDQSPRNRDIEWAADKVKTREPFGKQKSGERKDAMFRTNDIQHSFQGNSSRETLPQSASFQSGGEDTFPSAHSFLGHNSVGSVSPRVFPGPPYSGGPVQVPIYNTTSQNIHYMADPQAQAYYTGGHMSYAPGWTPPSPRLFAGNGYWNYPPHGSVGSFSPNSSMIRKDSGASFPIVEDVLEQSSESDNDIPKDQTQMDGTVTPEAFDQGGMGVYPDVLPNSYNPQLESPFANLGKKSADKALRSSFIPNMLSEEDIQKYPTYICPRCKTRQREFFTVSDAPQALSEPSNYLAFYFGIYVIASLFIFGLEEGWKPLDW